MNTYTIEQFFEFLDRAIRYIKEKQNTLSAEKKERIQQAKEYNLEPDFDEFDPEGEENPFRFGYYQFLRTVYIAIYATEEKSLYDSIFSLKGSPTPWLFLNGANWLKTMVLSLNEPTKELQRLYYEASKDVSLQRLISIAPSALAPWMENISEYEYYDILTRLSVRDTSILIDAIDCSRQIKNNLKIFLKDKNEEEFCNLCISEEVDIAKSAGLGYIWYNSIIKVNSDISKILAFNYEEETNLSSLNNMIEENYNDSTVSLGEKDLTAISDLQRLFASEEESVDNLEIVNFCNLCEIQMQFEGFLVFKTSLLECVSTNFKAISELKNHILSIPYYKELYQNLNADNLQTYNYRCYPPLDNFRDYFVSQRTLPDALNQTKSNKLYIGSEKSYSTAECIHIYEELVKSEMLDASDDAFYSFVYRTSSKYIGEKEPTVITWKGAPRELYYFIKQFVGEADTRLWAKTAKFFVFQDGTQPKTIGVINQAQTSTQRMETLVKRILQ